MELHGTSVLGNWTGRVLYCEARLVAEPVCEPGERSHARAVWHEPCVCVCAWITACAAISCAGGLPAKQGRRVAAEVLSV